MNPQPNTCLREIWPQNSLHPLDVREECWIPQVLISVVGACSVNVRLAVNKRPKHMDCAWPAYGQGRRAQVVLCQEIDQQGEAKMHKQVPGKVSRRVAFPLQLPPTEVKLGPEYRIHLAANLGPCVIGIDKGLELR